MAERTEIAWCDSTFNPWQGCTKVSPGCDNCYAEARQDTRLHAVKWGAGQPRKRTKTWGDPVKWNKAHAEFFAAHGRRQRVFCASLADVFDNEVPDEWRIDLFDLIHDTPRLDWLLLTKRIGNVKKMLPSNTSNDDATDFARLWPNVWLGATIVNQQEADRDIPKLLATPAAVRFLSMEPLLGRVDLRQWIGLECRHESGYMEADTGATVCRECDEAALIDWVIVGGESGTKARPMHPDWARSLRDQCKAAGVPLLFKQWGEWLPWTQFCDSGIDDPPEQTRFDTREWNGETWGDVGRPMWCDSKDGLIDDMQCVGRVGKKAAGRLLDGVTHDGYPEAVL
ncbi:phage Gp37/Gp68 family protein [Aquabacterium sp.]|uniref:phage Gp37/Gp68 family protein n=1 Tax=Aquabacterium sp. TaxID=1872578 RepID=UPI0025B95EB8|nr:phage Gp37/Gp68 family protein [Aquabacterium sp.]